MISDQDMNVALVNFETACCLNDKGIDEVPSCDQVALKREMRQVKYLIDYMGARAMERELLTAPEAGNSHGKRQASCPYASLSRFNDCSNSDGAAFYLRYGFLGSAYFVSRRYLYYPEKYAQPATS